MVDFNSVQNSRDCRADKSQIARSRIGPLQNAKQALFFVSNFQMFCFDHKSFDWLINIISYDQKSFDLNQGQKKSNNIFKTQKRKMEKIQAAE